ncbi:MAG: hypothetical protein A2902_00275 [Elusimicrobia bacterium RIFCSPLOWO2_01_FULL_64_13]|nr:MAG: hypothetical protein A2636_02990 [Elusimicrobia bacterium RIFCSPHIGHO2_01_FULL_64_10]OGR98005.1 MAG: hypothetical protein A2902_00275 [Elusimicrobia bacterium RIFCSPLOWO2_01_FULL_64_13]
MTPGTSPIGLIAGKGKFPLIFARETRKRGRDLVVVALKEEVSEDFSPFAKAVHPISAGKLDSIIQVFRKEGVREVVMAGRLEHTKLFSDIVPDLRTAQLLLRVKDRRADSVLGAVAEELSKDGITLLPSTTFLSHLLPEPGVLTRSRPTESEEKNIRFGIRMARGLSALDLGQTVVVKKRAVLAVEALEGTDECVRRGARLGGEGVIVVKSAKPGQDMRFDVPVIGTHTLTVLQETRARVLAVESRRTLILELEECVKRADAAGICIAAWEKDEAPS